MKTTILAALLLATGTAQADQHERISADDVYVLVCGNASAQYFIRPSGILFAMTGVNGAPNCVMATDTDGVRHVLCAVKESPDGCELARPGATI